MKRKTEPEVQRSPRKLAIGVTLVAVTVGALVTAAAAVSGAGICAAPAIDPDIPAGPADQVCYQLVRTLSERVGLATAALTAIIALTFIGLSRLAAAGERRRETADRI